MADLELKRLSKSFDDGQIVAVNDVSLEVTDGDFLVMVGPSGCGKSTTLNCVAGLEEPTEGQILLDGEDITDLPPQERDIAMVFQNYALYPHKDVAGNLGFSLRMRQSLDKDEIDRKVREVAEKLEIMDLLEKEPGELSGGQRQRVALGRAIIRDPKLFLMDEPLSNLDAKLRTQMRAELQKLQEELEVTTLYVTHDQTEAMTMGDKIAVMNGGQLQQIDPPLICYHYPANTFVAGFLGSPSMNFFDVELRDDALVHEAFEYELNDTLRSILPAGKTNLTLGIRPEAILLEPKSPDTTLSATVGVVEPKGDETIVYLNTGHGDIIASAGEEILEYENEEVNVVFPADEVHIFDTSTGESIVNRGGTVREPTSQAVQ